MYLILVSNKDHVIHGGVGEPFFPQPLAFSPWADPEWGGGTGGPDPT